jgi:hypothetical protein
MKRLAVALAVMLIVALAFAAGGYAASKSYQFTGTVKTASGGTMTVEKSAKEVWEFEVGKDTKGATAKVGDKVTVYYKMVATEIESKPATTAAAKTTAAKTPAATKAPAAKKK